MRTNGAGVDRVQRRFKRYQSAAASRLVLSGGRDPVEKHPLRGLVTEADVRVVMRLSVPEDGGTVRPMGRRFMARLREVADQVGVAVEDLISLEVGRQMKLVAELRRLILTPSR